MTDEDEYLTDWEKPLSEFANEYAGMENRVRQMVHAKTDEELKELNWAVRHPTEANCWWAIYRVSGLVSQLIQEEMGIRERKREREGEYHHQVCALPWSKSSWYEL